MDKPRWGSALMPYITGNKDLLFLCASILLSVIFLYFFAGPAYYSRLSAEEDIKDKREDLQSRQQLLTNIRQFNKDNSDLIIVSKKLSLFVPKRDDYEDFFTHISNLALINNLELVSYDIVRSSSSSDLAVNSSQVQSSATDSTMTSNENKLKEKQMSFSVRGDLTNFANFAKDLENGIPFVQEISLHILEEGDETESEEVAAETINMNPILLFLVDASLIHY
ncbi:MAG: hypothetical protein WC178_00270 [Candidatus Paceibacterota bacterium]